MSPDDQEKYRIECFERYKKAKRLLALPLSVRRMEIAASPDRERLKREIARQFYVANPGRRKLKA